MKWVLKVTEVMEATAAMEVTEAMGATAVTEATVVMEATAVTVADRLDMAAVRAIRLIMRLPKLRTGLVLWGRLCRPRRDNLRFRMTLRANMATRFAGRQGCASG